MDNLPTVLDRSQLKLYVVDVDGYIHPTLQLDFFRIEFDEGTFPICIFPFRI